jgi:serine/threonine-protein kinase
MSTKVTLIVKGGRLDGTEYAFEHPAVCMVGRALDCDIRLPNEGEFQTVSRHHCLLTVDPLRVEVWDCHSLNGTQINGRQIGWQPASELPKDAAPWPWKTYELCDGDELKVGTTIFQVHVRHAAPDCPERPGGTPRTRDCVSANDDPSPNDAVDGEVEKLSLLQLSE